MEELFGVSLPVFIGLTLVLFGGCAFMTGQAMAQSWKPVGLALPYALLLAAGDRFLAYGLFQEPLLTLPGFLFNGVVLLLILLLAFHLTRARRMITQYPWLYRRAGLFGWRERHPGQT